jgi:hypothetical protein
MIGTPTNTNVITSRCKEFSLTLHHIAIPRAVSTVADVYLDVYPDVYQRHIDIHRVQLRRRQSWQH